MCCLIQGTLQADSRRTMDALERLPALLAASLPVTDVTPLQTMTARQQPPALAQIAPADRIWLQGVLENALQLAAERVLKKQVGLERGLSTFEVFANNRGSSPLTCSQKAATTPSNSSAC